MNLHRLLDAVRRLDRSFDAAAWLSAVFVLVALKLVLIAHSEIATGHLDEIGYANSSLYWFGQKNAALSNFQRPPGMPMVAVAARAIGLPYRVAVELLGLAGIVWVSFQFARLVRSYLIAIFLAALLALHPWLFANNVSFMSEPPFLAFSLCWLACLSAFITSRSHAARCFWPILAGVFLLLMNITRLEEPVILAFAVIAGAYLSMLHRPNASSSGPAGLRAFGPILILPLALVVAGKQLVCFINYEKCGVPAICYLEAPGLRALLQALNSVQAPDPQRYAPITVRSLQMAMGASPSFHLLAQPLARFQTLAQSSPKRYLNKERGWFLMWDIIYSSMETRAGMAPPASGPAQVNRYWQRCADEINIAVKDGKLPKAQYAPYPLNPNYNLWVRSYPGSLWREVRSLCRIRARPEDDGGAFSDSRERSRFTADFYLLNQAANRRPELLASSFFDGYAYGGSGPVDGVALIAGDGTRLGSTFELGTELLPPELATRLTNPPSGPVPCHYSIWLPFAASESTRLVLLKGENRLSIQPIADPFHIEVGGETATATKGMAEIRIKEINAGNSVGWRERAIAFINHKYFWMELLACAMSFLLALSSAHDFLADDMPQRDLRGLLAIMVPCLLLRCSFYAFSDACTLPNWDRYPQALSLWMPIVFIGLSCLFGRRFGATLKVAGNFPREK